MSTQTERKISKSNQPHWTLRRITHQIIAFKHSPELSPKTPAAACMVLQEYFRVKESEAHFINYIPLKFTPIVYCQSNSLSISKHGDQHLYIQN